MKPRLEFSQMRRFSTGMTRLTARYPGWLISFMTQQAYQFLQKVRKRTPVDTGLLQKSWRLQSIKWEGRAVTATFRNDAVDGWAAYASFVEEGHAKPYKAGAGPGSADWVRGYFMLKYTEEEMQRLLPPRLQSEVRALFRRYGVG